MTVVAPKQKLAWITGASQGIGSAVALRLAAEGWTVAVSARQADKLSELSRASEALTGSIVPFELDVTDAEACTQAFEAIEEQQGAIDLVILNAGTHEPIDGKRFSVAPVRKLVEINLMGTVNCLAPVIERFVERQAGRIGVVASLAGYRGLPTSSGYGASKAGLINMCEALRPELMEQNVVLSCITPGFVRTPLTDRNPFPMPFLIDVDTAATRIVKGLESNRFEITFPRRFACIMKFMRILPYWAYFAITRRTVPHDQ